ncbi:hypothetical protein [Brevibacillus nitrificans]|uniref:hypothetical protein n=1 Tax=Brevibacillus nitrificans TaxID=651560 RepID=UPI002611774C|nr:hypothetical protein [Brevibacillus nitrificans]
MSQKRLLTSFLLSTLCLTPMILPFASLTPAQAASSPYTITYKLPPNPEKYLFLNVQMVTITNPQVIALQPPYVQEDYLVDMDSGGSHWKTFLDDNLRFQSSKKGFLWNIYNFIGVLPPFYPPNTNLNELNQRIERTQPYTPEERTLRESRAQLQMNAHLQPLIDAGYVLPEEIDDGMATKEFVATVLYRMFADVRPYHGGIDLKDSDNIAVRWAVEVGLPGFVVDSKGYLYPDMPLRMEAGPSIYAQEYPYDRLFQFINLILPGRKTATGWEYYQVKLLPGMVPAQPRTLISINGKPYDPFDYSRDVYAATQTNAYYQASKKISQYITPRFTAMLDQAREDALKPRVWDWSRDVIHHPTFSPDVAAYRKNKSSYNLSKVYQAIRKHYNLSIPQDSISNIKSVLDHVK